MTATVAEPPKMSSPVWIIPAGSSVVVPLTSVVSAPAMTSAGKMPSTRGSPMTVASSFVGSRTRCWRRSAIG